MNHNWTHKDFQAHAERQRDMQRDAENERRAREARSDKDAHRLQNMLLANVGKTLEQLGHHLQAQYGTTEHGHGQSFAHES